MVLYVGDCHVEVLGLEEILKDVVKLSTFSYGLDLVTSNHSVY
jgi:hypothetical protein